jgi:hypothetical protein
MPTVLEKKARLAAKAQSRRDALTPRQVIERRAKARVKAKAKRESMTPDQKAEYNAKKSSTQAARVAAMTPVEKTRYLNAAKARANNLTRSELKNRDLKSKYGITLEGWEDLFSSQGRTCACCGAEGVGRWATDHDHAKKRGDIGFVRGILCNSCNVGIGLLGDTLEGVLRAAAYLRRAE